ncbi:hypothetical protein [Deinococcus sp. NW-56]|uniref:hypothetical protein n=1 Tax=Deinococcus sp. NW-56 TaxID=2080419 RepID=UPI000CF3FBFE|nr:hypothetical protein [Deinococcus sp. NW-56]
MLNVLSTALLLAAPGAAAERLLPAQGDFCLKYACRYVKEQITTKEASHMVPERSLSRTEAYTFGKTNAQLTVERLRPVQSPLDDDQLALFEAAKLDPSWPMAYLQLTLDPKAANTRAFLVDLLSVQFPSYPKSALPDRVGACLNGAQANSGSGSVWDYALVLGCAPAAQGRVAVSATDLLRGVFDGGMEMALGPSSTTQFLEYNELCSTYGCRRTGERRTTEGGTKKIQVTYSFRNSPFTARVYATATGDSWDVETIEFTARADRIQNAHLPFLAQAFAHVAAIDVPATWYAPCRDTARQGAAQKFLSRRVVRNTPVNRVECDYFDKSSGHWNVTYSTYMF